MCPYFCNESVVTGFSVTCPLVQLAAQLPGPIFELTSLSRKIFFFSNSPIALLLLRSGRKTLSL